MNTLRDAVFADDVAFHIPGNNRLAGDYAGKDNVFAFLGKVMELSGGSFRLQVHDVIANDEHVVALTLSTGQREGKSATLRSVHVWHVRNGRVVELWEHPDQAGFDAFWS
jgi:ketosteroid isomerase-like protein